MPPEGREHRGSYFVKGIFLSALTDFSRRLFILSIESVKSVKVKIDESDNVK